MENKYNVEALCSVDDLKRMLGVGRNTAYSLLNNGSIRAWKVGGHWKIPESGIREYLQNLGIHQK